MAAAAPAPDSQLLLNHFKGQALSDHGARWNTCWERNQTGWDRGQYSVALLEVLTKGVPGGPAAEQLFPDSPASTRSSGSSSGATIRKKALVPGCGRGYDVLLLSSLGYDVVGVDLSPIGLQRAKEFAEESQKNGSYPVKTDKDEGGSPREPGSFRYVEGDFFKDDWLEQVGGKGTTFDLTFDYTFGCALPPQARPQWAKRHSDLLRPEGGRLVCLEFPSTKDPKDQGPPWAMPPHVYLAYLSRPGTEIPTDEHGGVKPPGTVSDDDDDGAGKKVTGLKRLVHGKPTTTHAAGMQEGQVVDWISVWSH